MLNRISGWIASWRRMLHEGLTENTWDGLSKARDAEAIMITVAGAPLLIVGLGLPYLGIEGAPHDWLLNAAMAWLAIVLAYGLYATAVSLRAYLQQNKKRD